MILCPYYHLIKKFAAFWLCFGIDRKTFVPISTHTCRQMGTIFVDERTRQMFCTVLLLAADCMRFEGVNEFSFALRTIYFSVEARVGKFLDYVLDEHFWYWEASRVVT